MDDAVAAGLRAELDALAPDGWPGVLRRVEIAQAAAELLADLDRPPLAASRLGWELRWAIEVSLA